MEQEVIGVLRDAFPGIEVEIEVRSSGRIFGSVVWAGFADLDQVDRQTKIRSVLREKLGDDAKQIGILFTYTPDEIEAMRAA